MVPLISSDYVAGYSTAQTQVSMGPNLVSISRRMPQRRHLLGRSGATPFPIRSCCKGRAQLRGTRGFWRIGASFRERRKGSQPELNRLLSMAARCRPSASPVPPCGSRLLRNQQRQIAYQDDARRKPGAGATHPPVGTTPARDGRNDAGLVDCLRIGHRFRKRWGSELNLFAIPCGLTP
jgi:hypothetical protein